MIQLVKATSDNADDHASLSALKLLHDAVINLTYPSDSDEPWDAFAWPAATSISTPRQAIEQHVDNARALVEVPVENFFEQLSEADNAQQYDRLRQVLQKTVSNLSAFRVGDGEVRVDVYLIGALADGTFAGIWTTSVET